MQRIEAAAYHLGWQSSSQERLGASTSCGVGICPVIVLWDAVPQDCPPEMMMRVMVSGALVSSSWG